MKLHIRFIYFFIIMGLLPLLSHGQNPEDKVGRPLWKKSVDSIFMKSSEPEKVLKDSVALYSFCLNLEIIKDQKRNKSKVVRLSVNDSIVYRLFPAYKKLYAINYTSLLRNQKKVNLVIPIIISNTSPKAARKYNRQGDLLIDIESTETNFQRSFSSIVPKNKGWLEDGVILPPYIIRILNIQ
ncbi:hypothetical protein [Pedobacter cryoconitis]|uniref:Uncharacterized protein n=1 Tax=Pedobacter cryoconitis TaxID=188932 RepID=A0A7X0J131_9SPHI|nr:hypothetical protein [Pedobacter cryoconitis]MBB6498975.1 hypothetical protein [Pedobacter cryoconitis]